MTTHLFKSDFPFISMQYTALGNTGIQVSKFGLGCWAFQGGDYWGDQDDRDSVDTVRAALDAGVTLFDTAASYGNGKSEEVLGKALVGRRSEAVIATAFKFATARKPAFEILYNLIRKEWWIKLQRTTGTNAVLKLQGFYGKYLVPATHNGKTAERTIHLTKNGVNDFEILFQ